jgi:uncharacterized membrane protein YphA (DoxX/SURF4 family)
LRRFQLHRLFSAFLGGWQGVALLLLRIVFSLSVLIQADFYLQRSGTAASSILVGLLAVASGALLLVGFLTPIAGCLVGVGAVAIMFSILPASTPSLFDSKAAVFFAGTMLVELVLLGPGAFSVDARLFGRRKIIIPPPVSFHRH